MTNFQPYPYQLAVAEQILNGKGVILQAPTGAGKTEAAIIPFIHALKHFVPEAFPRKCIYSVPMRVLANQFVEKYRQTVIRNGLEATVAIQTGARPEDPKFESDLIFTTIDQTLSNYLGIPYALSNGQANLNAGAVASSYLVFDEFHLYDPKAIETTVLMLKHLQGAVPFLLMTATFSTTMLAELQAELDPDGQGRVVVIPTDEAGKEAMQALPSQQKTRRYHTVDDLLTAEEVWQRHQQLPAGGRSVAICNTVDRARDLFKKLQELNAEQLTPYLLHSRFYQSDRNDKEERLRNEFHKDRTIRTENSVIFVSTQVIEVGLDITCDVLHTELAPANAVLQRAGRCARYAGETGEVYIYQLPSVEGDSEKTSYAPYHQHGQAEVCQLSWQAFAERSGQVLTFEDEHAVLNQAHGAADERFIEQLRDNRFRQEDMMADAMGYQERGLIRELIRDVNAKSIIIHPDFAPDAEVENPWQWESFSMFSGSVYKAFEELEEKAAEIGHVKRDDEGNTLSELEWVMLRLYQEEDPEESYQTKVQYRWRKIRESNELEGALVVAVHPRLARYTVEAGLELAVDNQTEWQPRQRDKTSPFKRDHSSKCETYQEHIERLYRAYQYQREYDHPTQKGTVLREPLRAEMAYVFNRLEQNFDLPAGTLDQAARLVIGGHDIGKLHENWQAWIHRWQAEYERGTTMADTVMLARPDNYEPDENEDRIKQIKRDSPNHAAEGAYAMLPLTRAWCESLPSGDDEAIDGLFHAINTAIVRHHTATHRGSIKQPYHIHPHGKAALDEAFDLVGLGELPLDEMTLAFDTDEAADLEELLVEPDKPLQMMFSMLFSRVLRLADQRAASQK